MIELKCGDKTYPLDLPPDRIISVLRPKEMKAAGTPQELVERALDGCAEFLARFQPGEE